MNGEHPWLDWIRVLVIFLGGLVIVMILVRLLIKWAQRNEKPDERWREVEKARAERDDDRPEGGTDKHAP
jgi:flagellar biosynthesis/type III secretory pathway M-ring protein FliF/YscJ